jgi:uncharacterized protein (DUF1778 family)
MEPEKSPNTQPAQRTKGNKSAWLNLRFTPEEKALIQARAQAAGQNTNEYMWRTGLGMDLKERLPVELRQVLSATSKDLHQYLKLAQLGHLDGVDEAAVGAIIKALNQALR